MKRAFVIGHTDLRLFLKRKSAFVWLLLIPMALMYLMGHAVLGPGDPHNRRATVLIQNADTNFLGDIFLAELGKQDLRIVNTNDDDDSIAGEIRIPTDFTGKILRQEQAKVRFIERNGANQGDTAIIQIRLVRALIAMNGHLLEAATQSKPGDPLQKSQLRALMDAPNPVSLDARFAGRKPMPSGFNFSVPGNLVLYVMMNLIIFGGSSIAAERRNGVIKRMMVHSLTRGQLVMGKIYGLMLLGVVQIVFFLAFGKFVFHVSLGANLPAVTLVLIVLAWVAGSLGVLIGSVTKAEDRVIGICVMANLIMGAVGGCWWPLEIAPPLQQTIALWTPTGEALKALHQLITFGSGFEAILLPLAILLAFGAAANLLAARLFRY